MKRKPRPETFVSWLAAAAPRGWSMREYVDRFGAVSPRDMIESARERCGIEVVLRRHGTSGVESFLARTRMRVKEDA